MSGLRITEDWNENVGRWPSLLSSITSTINHSSILWQSLHRWPSLQSQQVQLIRCVHRNLYSVAVYTPRYAFGLFSELSCNNHHFIFALSICIPHSLPRERNHFNSPIYPFPSQFLLLSPSCIYTHTDTQTHTHTFTALLLIWLCIPYHQVYNSISHTSLRPLSLLLVVAVHLMLLLGPEHNRHI